MFWKQIQRKSKIPSFTIQMVRLTQINIRHSTAAYAALLLHISERDEDIMLIQEPLIFKAKILEHSIVDSVAIAWVFGISSTWIIPNYIAHGHVDLTPYNLFHNMIKAPTKC